MRRILLDLAGFFALLLLLEYALGTEALQTRLGRADSWGHLNTAMANLSYYGKTDPPDIMVVGNSQAYRTVNPYILADELEAMMGERVSIINNGVPWIGAAGNERIITELFAAFYTPPIILMNVSPFMFGELPAQDWQAATEGSAARLWFSEKPYTPALRWLLRHSRLLQYSNNLAAVLAGDFTPAYVTGTSRGYVPRADTNPNIAAFAAETNYPPYTVRNAGTNALESLIDWCEENGVLLVLFTAPEHEGLLINGGTIYAEFLADMQRFDVASERVIFLDLTTEGRLSDENYYDVIHVNDSGATLWTQRLARYMVRAEVLQRGGVGIRRVYGDNNLSIFHRQKAELLEFFIIQDGGGVLVAQLDSAQWQGLQEGDTHSFEGGGYRFKLEKREAQYYWIYLYDAAGVELSNAPFAIE